VKRDERSLRGNQMEAESGTPGLAIFSELWRASACEHALVSTVPVSQIR
jgi:hypothetical protein